MSNQDNPEMLDDAVYRKFKRAVGAKQYLKMLDVLDEAAGSLGARPYMGDMGKIAATTVLIIMVDSIKVLSGEAGAVARDFPHVEFPGEDAGSGRRLVETLKWQRWLHSLEVLALITGESLGEFPQVIREEHLRVDGFVRSDATTRLIRLWRASRPFIFRWERLSLLSRARNDPNDLDSYDEHAARLLDTMEYLFGRPQNWSQETRDLHAEQLQLLNDNLRLSPSALIQAYMDDMDRWRDEEMEEWRNEAGNQGTDAED